MAEESKGAILAAMGANFAIAIGKLGVGLVTGSAALLAEAGHSAADTVNQVFLLIGLNLSTTEADDAHPHGYGKEAFFWSFLAAIFIFVAGAVFSVYEGTRTLVQEENHHRSEGELLAAFGVLGAAVVFETVSLAIALRGVLAGARRKGWSLAKFMRESPDLTIKTVLFEDSAALAGLLIAAGGLMLSELLHTEVWDGIASLLIGAVLTLTAFMLGLQSRTMLLGASANAETREAILRVIKGFPEVERVVRLLTMQMGAHSVLVTGEIQVKQGLTAVDVEGLLVRLDERIGAEVHEVRDTFWELRRSEAPDVPARPPAAAPATEHPRS